MVLAAAQAIYQHAYINSLGMAAAECNYPCYYCLFPNPFSVEEIRKCSMFKLLGRNNPLQHNRDNWQNFNIYLIKSVPPIENQNVIG